ncbi:hypothetical protein P153DRAFT_378606 [Dothidotthia symphoricarpi CBS 119687]|uniref:Vacuolar import and degradation protein-domain-containing protein n=1 Tax=Dothidotthia symphoricarpi CBS 119687 TaxID=1392245 RepID=A0A6A6A2K8_9PLEO|nr:uncharacterized protein P153DRAFT_378606 [Dothidotthia symphoricarpi CBS 119687]KAF2125776.1 hypothetical protein P153DRAFT_378606 [Dothidotthia symphoricarpi CBS 119687]
MPPANSPDPEASYPPSASFISALAPLNRDVPNLAATLGTHVDEDGDDSDDGFTRADDVLSFAAALGSVVHDGDTDEARASLHFLRAAHDEGYQLPLHRSHDGLRLLNQQDQRDRLRRSMDRLNRLSDAYGDRVPSQNSLYDWSPAPDDDMDALLAADQPGPDMLRMLGREHWASERRSQGVSQAQRRQHRLSARSRTEALRGTHHPEQRDRYTSTSSLDRHMAMPPTSSLDRERRDMLSRVDAYRRGYHDRSSPAAPSSPMLELSVEYLSHIRSTDSPDESLAFARGAGLLRKNSHRPDFLTRPDAIPPPAPTSWLAPGAVLSGCQHATAAHHPDRWPVKVTLHTVDWHTMQLSATMEAYNVPSHTATRASSSSITTFLEGEILDFRKYTLLTESFQSSAANDAMYWRKLPPLRDLRDEEVGRCLGSERWWSSVGREWIFMRWKERCFVRPLNSSFTPPPTHHVPTRTSTTTTPRDAIHSSWPPQQQSHTHTFRPHHADRGGDESHASFDDSGCGLTISGFYYVCLRRSDGRVEGLYYDPMSSPYQCLELESVRGGVVGAWGFS